MRDRYAARDRATDATQGLSVTEIYVLSNSSDRVVAGSGQPVLHFGLPAARPDLQLDPSLQSDMIGSRAMGWITSMRFPGGVAGQQIVCLYTTCCLTVHARSSRAIYFPMAVW